MVAKTPRLLHCLRDSALLNLPRPPSHPLIVPLAPVSLVFLGLRHACCLSIGNGGNQDGAKAKCVRGEARQLHLPHVLPVHELYDLDARLQQEKLSRYVFTLLQTYVFRPGLTP